MPRENSFSDSEGRSLTPNMSEDERFEPTLPTVNSPELLIPIHRPALVLSPTLNRPSNPTSPSKRSLHSRVKSPSISQSSTKSPSQQRSRTWPSSNLAPIERFRAAVRKVIMLLRGTSFLQMGIRRVGAEPGVNPRRSSANLLYGHIRQDCVIEVIDYSSVRSSVGRMTNAEFINMMEDPKASEKEPWVKVRWINIGGLSWDVMKAVSIKYDLHPLAIEDIFHTRSQNRSKADYYSKHLFLRVLCHELAREEHSDSPESAATGSMLRDSIPHFVSPDLDHCDIHEEAEAMVEEEEMQAHTKKKRRRFFSLSTRFPGNERDVEGILGSKPAGSYSSLARLMVGYSASRNRNRVEQQVTLDALKGNERVDVTVSPIFIFLLRDGTVISFRKDPSVDFTSPISQRIHQRDTVLRTSADPSLLVHAILDLIVDRALEVIDEYHNKINKFEHAVLLKPNVKTVRYLHILSGDLILHKRTLEPIKTLIYGLRRYDLDRCAALIDMSDPANADAKVVGFMSHKSKIYLADVFDHMAYILTSLEMFAGIAENLIGYTFNLASYEMNQVMRRLTLATIIFLPLTLLTGYFGMNFKSMWSVDEHSDLFFWKIALPVMAVIVPMFMWSDIRSLVHYIEKRMKARNALKTVRVKQT